MAVREGEIRVCDGKVDVVRIVYRYIYIEFDCGGCVVVLKGNIE